jgi:ubiquinone/menaquinone biosynthesis C-methylase UbiE
VIDPVPRHVKNARELSNRHRQITAEVGDARQLRADDETFDAAVVLGPLYHLTDREERLRALREARRVVRPGGKLFVAAVSRFASLFYGLAREFLFDPNFRRIVEGDLADGQHRNPERRPHWFTTAYFHHPGELRHEAEAAELDVIGVVGVEGLAGWLPHLAARWTDPHGREAILYAAQAIEDEPTLLGLSAHLILIAQRPPNG